MSTEELYISWSSSNLGSKTGIWYSKYLIEMGSLLEDFGIKEGLKNNFFEYHTYEEFLPIYKELSGEDDGTIQKILNAQPNIRYVEPMITYTEIFRQGYIELEISQGKKRNPKDHGGIARFGTVLRSYLKFHYYTSNDIEYPKKKEKEEFEFVDNEVNYWIMSTGTNAKSWEEFNTKEIITLDIVNVSDFGEFESQEEVREYLIEERETKTQPFNDAKAVWDFYYNMQPGDIVYAKVGMNRILGRGIVKSKYKYKEGISYREIDWTHKGTWVSRSNLSPKTLTNLTNAQSWISYMEDMIVREEIDEKSLFVNEFKEWHLEMLKNDGEFYDIKTVDQRISCILDLELFFGESLFDVTEVETLRLFREMVKEDKTYKKYKETKLTSLDMFIRYIETKPLTKLNKTYSLNDFLEDVFITKEEYLKISSVLQNKKNIIFKGAPGVGKTFIADRLAYSIMGEIDKDRIRMIQFHQSYSYEDFIEGYRPSKSGEGFEIQSGPFVQFARKAERDPERPYFFIIDEINRGNMSKIFGELMMLIESDKRGKSINLLYSNEKFSVPDNLLIIGMMNTADRSLALIDYALRRRFSFIDMKPAFDNETFIKYTQTFTEDEQLNKVILVVKELNQEIKELLGSGFMIGHSYFVDHEFSNNMKTRLSEVIEFEIIPQLEEYWFDDENKAIDWGRKLRNALQ